jgi:hypothetical protein
VSGRSRSRWRGLTTVRQSLPVALQMTHLAWLIAVLLVIASLVFALIQR